MTRNRLLARRYLLALAAYMLLALAFTWPLALHLDSQVMSAGGRPGDNFEYVWKMWWVPHALLERGISPFVQPDIAYPDGYPLAYGEITPSHTFLMMPVTWLLGATTTYNLAILLSIVLTGWFMYLLAARWLVGSGEDDLVLRTLCAFLSGVVLAFCAYRTQRIAGHLPLIDTHWLVLALYAVDRWLERQRVRDGLLAGLGFSLAALSSWYYAFLLALLLPIYMLAYAGRRWRVLFITRRAGLALVGAGLLIIVLCGPFLLPYLQVAAPGVTEVSLDDARFWSASVVDYLLPSARHPLWGGLVQRIAWPFAGIDMPYEFMLAIGWVTLLLAIIGWRRTAGARWRGLKWLIAAAFILSLGPYLTLGRLPTPLPLPALILREVLPFARGMRTWGRFSIMMMLGLSLLAGYGALMILRRRSTARARTLLFVGILAATLFEMWAYSPLVTVGPRPVDVWLAQQSDTAPIMQYPVEEALSGPAMLYTRYHHKPVIYGYGTYFPFIFRERYPELYTFPSDEAIDRLTAWGVHYVLVDTASKDYAAVGDQPRLKHIITLDDQAVYALVSQEPLESTN